MKLQVNVPRRWAYAVLIALLFGSGLFAVWAYNANFDTAPKPDTEPAIAGHSPDEILVKIPDATGFCTDTDGRITLQTAIANKCLGGGTQTGTPTPEPLTLGTKDCYMVRPSRWTSASCKDGFYVKAIYKSTDNDWDGYGTMCCRADGSADDPNLPDATTLHSKCPWTWGGITCDLNLYGTEPAKQ